MNNDAKENKLGSVLPSLSSDSDREEEEVGVNEKPPLTWSHPITIGTNRKRLLSKQLSMKETTREAKWEKRRRQILRKSCTLVKEDEVNLKGNGDIDMEETKSNEGSSRGNQNSRLSGRVRSLTDEDLDELRGSIELGFGFNEENGGQDLCNTLPALDLYFAVNRQFSDPKLRLSISPSSTPSATSSSSTLCGTPSPRSPNELIQPLTQSASGDSWKIFSPGDNPQHVKTRLRHWAQVVACSVKHCC